MTGHTASDDRDEISGRLLTIDPGPTWVIETTDGTRIRVLLPGLPTPPDWPPPLEHKDSGLPDAPPGPGEMPPVLPPPG